MAQRGSTIDNKYEILKEMIKEANLMKRLDHPALPRIVDIIDENNIIYIFMDYIEGESLDRILRDKRKQESKNK